MPNGLKEDISVKTPKINFNYGYHNEWRLDNSVFENNVDNMECFFISYNKIIFEAWWENKAVCMVALWNAMVLGSCPHFSAQLSRDIFRS